MRCWCARSATILHHAPLVLPALEPRGAVMADIRLNGQEIRIVGMHLDLSGLWRRRQAHAVMMHIEQQPRALPTVMMGDMNEWRRHGGCLGDFAQHYGSPKPGRASTRAGRSPGSTGSS